MVEERSGLTGALSGALDTLQPTLTGAIDVVVVRQPDGSLKCSPFHVRFGRYQGLLRSREKVVRIAVNGVTLPDLCMHLDNSGGAFFLEEVVQDPLEGVCSPPSDGYSSDLDALAAGPGSEERTKGLKVQTNLERVARQLEEGCEDEELEPCEEPPPADGEDDERQKRRSSWWWFGSSNGDGEAKPAPNKAKSEGCLSPQSSSPPSSPSGPVGRRRPEEHSPPELTGALGACVSSAAPPFGSSLPNESEMLSWSARRNGGVAAASAAAAAALPPRMELSLCGSDALELEGEEEREAAFERERLTPEALERDPRVLEQNAEALVCRFGGRGGRVCRAADALPELLAREMKRAQECEAEAEALVASSLSSGGRGEHAKHVIPRTRSEGAPAPGSTSPSAAAAAASTPATPAQTEAGSSAWWPRSRANTNNGAMPTTTAAAVTPASSTAAPRRPRYRRKLKPTAQQLSDMNLQDGVNNITFTFTTAVWGEKRVETRAFLWEWNSRVVISDVDGTVTRSDVLGHVLPAIGKDWSHDGVTALYNNICDHGYKVMFLSARAIGMSNSTRSFLTNLSQEGETLVEGPIIISSDSLLVGFYREVIRRTPHEFKIAALTEIKSLFPPENPEPFDAGFGNRDTDELAYRTVGVPAGRIFLINPKGEVVCDSARHVVYTLGTINHQLLDVFFPAVAPGAEEPPRGTDDELPAAAPEYLAPTFWRVPSAETFDLADCPELA
mmetsp:Transcript_23881/g.77656  ORF Transcript_23881/g.77656 Transcript_23881/m.77656 type:complete len:729 (+) Transcript_23881:3-2189(+)